MVEIMKRIGTFICSIEHIVDGAPDENGFIQALQRPREHFKREIRQTAPNFLPLEQPGDVNAASDLPQPGFLENEEAESEWQPNEAGRPIFVDDVMNRANSLVMILFSIRLVMTSILSALGLGSYQTITHILSRSNILVVL